MARTATAAVLLSLVLAVALGPQGALCAKGKKSPPPPAVTKAPSIGTNATKVAFPNATEDATFKQGPRQVLPGRTFDGAMKRYGRGIKCQGLEGNDTHAVFVLGDGATLKNAIIGADQIEGVHCLGACTIENVWWEAVCDDALTGKGKGDILVKGGGAMNAPNKVIQHNGEGTVTIDGFYVETFGMLYRSCGNCNPQFTRNVVLQNVVAVGGGCLAGINTQPYKDTATFKNISYRNVKRACNKYKGVTSGEPTLLGSGFDATSCMVL